MQPISRSPVYGVILAAFAACTPASTTTEDGSVPRDDGFVAPDDASTPRPDAGPGADAGAGGDDAGGDSDAGSIGGCPTFEPGNPRHRAYGQETSTPIIRADEVWTNDNVYFVLSLFEVSSCTLTIEAGTRVCLAAGLGVPPTISVSGSGATEGRVFVNGTAEAPVIFDRAGTDERYSGFYFSGPSDARFDHVRFIGGGVGGLGALRFGAGHLHPAVLRDVHLESFYKTGISLQNPDGLSADSTLYLDSQQPLSTEPIITTMLASARTITPTTTHIAATIPAETRVIRFIDRNVQRDLTLYGTIGADYAVQTGDLFVRRSGTDPIPTLTMEAGARLRFGDGELSVGFVGSGNEGALIVAGTPTNPVVLTSAASSAARGQWNGVTLFVGALGPGTALRNLRIENAGGPGGASLNNCRSVSSLAAGLKLRPIVSAPYAGPTLAGIEIVRSGGDGLAFGCVTAGCLTTDYAAAVTGSDNAGTLLRALGCP